MTDERKQKILIVDDDPSLQEALSTALSGQAYAVEYAFDGASGLEKANNTNPDLIDPPRYADACIEWV